MSGKELASRVHSAVYEQTKGCGPASAGVLVATGELLKEHRENWRRGRVGFLERVCKRGLENCRLSVKKSVSAREGISSKSR
jgi:hypothetical protein